MKRSPLPLALREPREAAGKKPPEIIRISIYIISAQYHDLFCLYSLISKQICNSDFSINGNRSLHFGTWLFLLKVMQLSSRDNASRSANSLDDNHRVQCEQYDASSSLENKRRPAIYFWYNRLLGVFCAWSCLY
jgi:hypothetical protein